MAVTSIRLSQAFLRQPYFCYQSPTVFPYYVKSSIVDPHACFITKSAPINTLSTISETINTCFDAYVGKIQFYSHCTINSCRLNMIFYNIGPYNWLRSSCVYFQDMPHSIHVSTNSKVALHLLYDWDRDCGIRESRSCLLKLARFR